MDGDPEQLERNAIAFYDLMFNQCRPLDAIERFVGDTYIERRVTSACVSKGGCGRMV